MGPTKIQVATYPKHSLGTTDLDNLPEPGMGLKKEQIANILNKEIRWADWIEGE